MSFAKLVVMSRPSLSWKNWTFEDGKILSGRWEKARGDVYATEGFA